MITERDYDVLVGPLVTEKTTLLSENGQIAFRVRLDATKAEIRKAVENLFDVKVTAVNTVCPHLGCFVDYRAEKPDFFCPCHDSKFDVKDGSVQGGVSPRGMDTLEVKFRKGTEIWVKYQRFRANTKEKIVIS